MAATTIHLRDALTELLGNEELPVWSTDQGKTLKAELSVLVTYLNGVLDFEAAGTGASEAAAAILAHNVSSGVHGVTGNVVGTTDQQTLDKKTLTDVPRIVFNVNPTIPAHTPGQIYWDDTDKTLLLNMAHPDVSLSLGQEQYIRGFNNTGQILANGTVVYVNGTQGQRPSVAKADASTEATNYAIGVVTHPIGTTGDDRYGYITTLGIVRDINTSDWTPGVPLWLSTDAGLMTQDKPVAPNHAVYIGIPLNSTNNGSIFVNPNIGNELNELHDVHYPTPPAGGEFLVWNGTNQRWENTVLNVTANDIDSTGATVGQVPTADGAGGVTWEDQQGGGGGGGGIAWEVASTPITAANGKGYLADTSGGSFTITLPAAPSAGDNIAFADNAGTWDTANLIIGRNGNTIMGLAEDLTCDIENGSIALVYNGTTWRLI